jgi:hypothetical protein
VVRLLDTRHPKEIAAFGAIRVKIPWQSYLEQVRDVARFRKGSEVVRVGTFSQPPRIEDLRDLSLDSSEIRLLRECKVGNCRLKMSAEMTQRLHAEVDWTQPDFTQRGNELYRQMLLEYVRDYLSRGDSALIEYTDKEKRIRVGDELQSLLKASPYLDEYLPEFKSFIENFPNAWLADTEHLVYWEEEKLADRPVITLTHVAFHTRRDGDTTSIIVGSKQIYASHYFNASLSLSAFIHSPAFLESGGGYLLYLNRSRIDLLGGFLDFLKEWIIKKRVREGLEKYLVLVKQRLEAAPAAGVAGER